jgi:hypothetical protein
MIRAPEARHQTRAPRSGWQSETRSGGPEGRTPSSNTRTLRGRCAKACSKASSPLTQLLRPPTVISGSGRNSAYFAFDAVRNVPWQPLAGEHPPAALFKGSLLRAMTHSTGMGLRISRSIIAHSARSSLATLRLWSKPFRRSSWYLSSPSQLLRHSANTGRVFPIQQGCDSCEAADPLMC